MTGYAHRAPVAAIRPAHLAIGSLALGIVAFWIALPPVHARNVALPFALGVVAVLGGMYAVRLGAGRLGWSAIVVGPVGAGMGYLATRSSVSHLDDVFTWSTLIASMLVFATPLTFAAMGGLYSERSGVVNVGLEGMMLMGAFWGIYSADRTSSWVLGLLIAMFAGGAMGLLHAFFAVHLRADQIVGGMAINFLSLGITGYFFVQLYAGQNVPAGVPRIPNVNFHIHDVYFFGPAFGRLNLMTWAAFALVIGTYVVVFKTPIGLRIRACGEHPRAADTVGISVYAVRYGAVVLSGMLSAAGGAYLSIGFVGTFNENMTGGRGFIALAALIFGKWRPFGAFGAALLFGLSTAIAFRMQVYSDSLPGIDVLIQVLPYALTLIAVAGVIGRSVPPAAVGRPYKKQ